MNGIPQRGGAGGGAGYSAPLVEQLQNIGNPLKSKMTQTTTQPGSFDPMQLMMMLMMMGIFDKDKTTEKLGPDAGLPGQRFGMNEMMKILQMGKPQMGAGGAPAPIPGMPF